MPPSSTHSYTERYVEHCFAVSPTRSYSSLKNGRSPSLLFSTPSGIRNVGRRGRKRPNLSLRLLTLDVFVKGLFHLALSGVPFVDVDAVA